MEDGTKTIDDMYNTSCLPGRQSDRRDSLSLVVVTVTAVQGFTVSISPFNISTSWLKLRMPKTNCTTSIKMIQQDLL
jgi:hypothetical protein